MPPAMIWSFGRSSALVTMTAVVGGVVGSADGVQIDLQQSGAGLDLLLFLDQSGEALALHLDGVHADMDQQLDAVVAGDADGVQGGSHLRDGAVKRGSSTVSPVGSMPQPGPRMAVANVSSVDLLQRDHRAVDGSHDGHLFACKFRGGIVLAAKQFIKNSPL